MVKDEPLTYRSHPHKVRYGSILFYPQNELFNVGTCWRGGVGNQTQLSPFRRLALRMLA